MYELAPRAVMISQRPLWLAVFMLLEIGVKTG
jgi:hypothetical protein